MHTASAISERVAATDQHSYIGDVVLGAVDGAVTTFAIVAGAAGSGLSTSVALILGSANVIADSLSMAAGNYLKARSDEQQVSKYRAIETLHIDTIPEAEKAEIREIFFQKGIKGEELEDIVNIITNNRETWINTMLTEEWGLQLHPPKPLIAAASTLVAFIAAGLVPLFPLLFFLSQPASEIFLLICTLTGVTFFGIGYYRGVSSDDSGLKAGVETLFLGGLAASAAYFVGGLLENLVR